MFEDRHHLANAGYIDGPEIFTRLTDLSLGHTTVGSSCENKITNPHPAVKILKKKKQKKETMGD